MNVHETRTDMPCPTCGARTAQAFPTTTNYRRCKWGHVTPTPSLVAAQ